MKGCSSVVLIVLGPVNSAKKRWKVTELSLGRLEDSQPFRARAGSR